jgi:hypothetical protein
MSRKEAEEDDEKVTRTRTTRARATLNVRLGIGVLSVAFSLDGEFVDCTSTTRADDVRHAMQKDQGTRETRAMRSREL